MSRKIILTAAIFLITLYAPLSLFSQIQDFEINGTVLVRYLGNAENVIIPEGVTAIEDRAFFSYDFDARQYLNDNVKSITIPASVSSIADTAFYGDNSRSLISITVDIQNRMYSSVEGVLFNKNRTSLVRYPPNKLAISYTIPSSVVSIGAYAFSGCEDLISINIPARVTSIGDSAFSGCTSLTSVTIPSRVTSIGGSAFRGCTSLTSVTIPSSVRSIGGSAFSGCTSLTSVNIPSRVTSLDYGTFYACNALLPAVREAIISRFGQHPFNPPY